MGFADTGASRLRNNRNLVGQKSRMNDAHLKIGKSNKKTDHDKNKMSKDDYEKFKFEMKIKRQRENRKTVFTFIFLILIVILVVILFLTFNK